LVKNHHLKETWALQFNGEHLAQAGHFTKQEGEYIKFFKKYLCHAPPPQGCKIGRVLEIGPGNGNFARYLLDHHAISSYTILDLERHMVPLKHRLKQYHQVDYISSFEYEKIFEKEYDLLIAIQCLSETPAYYADNIFNNIKAAKTFILDGNPSMPGYDNRLLEFTQTYPQWEVVQTNVCNSKLYMGGQ